MPAKRKKQSNINLLPKDTLRDTTVGQILSWGLTSFRAIVIVVELVVISGFLFRFYLDVQNADLDDKVAQKSALISSYAELEKNFKQTQTKLGIYSNITTEQNTFVPVLEAVVRRLPLDAQLTFVSRNEDTLELIVQSENEQSIEQLVANLQAEPLLANVTLSQVESQAESSLIEFTLRAQIVGANPSSS